MLLGIVISPCIISAKTSQKFRKNTLTVKKCKKSANWAEKG
jgi:hypothetical protein